MTTLPTLYKMTNTGKIQQWSISFWLENPSLGIYKVTHGQVDGKQQTTQTEILSGKNIGKANETSILEQTKSEAESLWTKKRDRSGYSESVPNKKPLRPMLAKDFFKEHHKLDWDHVVTQPKLDGVRMMAVCDGGSIQLISRQGKVFNTCKHIQDALKKIDASMIFDGELYSDTLSFQEIISAVKRDDDIEITKQIQYHIYDIIDTASPFKDRHEKIASLKLSDPLYAVETNDAFSMLGAISQYDIYRRNNYEGAIVRNTRGLYKINGRSSDLLKLKEFQDEEFRIIDIVEGTGKFKGMGIFVCETGKGTAFRVTPAATEDEKREIWTNRSSYIGKLLTVQYFEQTTSLQPVPRFPVGKAVRDYENP